MDLYLHLFLAGFFWHGSDRWKRERLPLYSRVEVEIQVPHSANEKGGGGPLLLLDRGGSSSSSHGHGWQCSGVASLLLCGGASPDSSLGLLWHQPSKGENGLLIPAGWGQKSGFNVVFIREPIISKLWSWHSSPSILASKAQVLNHSIMNNAVNYCYNFIPILLYMTKDWAVMEPWEL